MYRLWATIVKDSLILGRDKVGLLLMFVMPILLAVVIAMIQNSAFRLVNENKVPLLLCNRDEGEAGKQLIKAIRQVGMFRTQEVPPGESGDRIADRMHKKDALVAIVIPKNFSKTTGTSAKIIAGRALSKLGLQTDSSAANPQPNPPKPEPITVFYHPVLQESFRNSIQGALHSALIMLENKQVLQKVYAALDEKETPDSLEIQMAENQIPVVEIPVSRNGSRNIPNATQHNIPAWTIFAMFFIVISLGSSLVREKLNGSFIRLKTLPTNYLVALLSKQIVYLGVTLIQALAIFSIGVWLFPAMGLPRLNIPDDFFGLLIVTLVCGWCAVSYAICIGMFAKTEEQANGFGAVSIVLMAAIGGVLVPSFVMPSSFHVIMQLSPLHWCLEAYYGLFLEGGKLKDILLNIIPLLAITAGIQFITLWRLKRARLI